MSSAGTDFDIKVVVFRRLFQFFPSPGGPKDGYTYVIRDDQAEPLVAVLNERAAKALGPARLFAEGQGRGRAEWAPGMVLYTASVEEVTGARAVALGGTYTGPLGSVGFTYRLWRNGRGEWTIYEEELGPIS